MTFSDSCSRLEPLSVETSLEQFSNIHGPAIYKVLTKICFPTLTANISICCLVSDACQTNSLNTKHVRAVGAKLQLNRDAKFNN